MSNEASRAGLGGDQAAGSHTARSSSLCPRRDTAAAAVVASRTAQQQRQWPRPRAGTPCSVTWKRSRTTGRRMDDCTGAGGSSVGVLRSEDVTGAKTRGRSQCGQVRVGWGCVQAGTCLVPSYGDVATADGGALRGCGARSSSRRGTKCGGHRRAVNDAVGNYLI